MFVLKQRLSSVPPLVWVLVLTAACLAPFTNKAFHVDDTLFLRAAEQICEHPADFYGGKMNWFGREAPLIEVVSNPPLTCYFLALVASVAGWSERVLHLAFILPALAAAWGIFALARNFCARPAEAAVAAVLTPVFLISATNVMCDVMLVAFWLWAVVLFEKGAQHGSWIPFVGSGMLGGLAVWTKFPGLAIVPLLGMYGALKLKRAGFWFVAPLLPLLFAAVCDGLTDQLYGHGMLTEAAGLASDSTDLPSSVVALNFLGGALQGLSFLGGCFLPILLYVLWLRPRWSEMIGFLLAVAALLLLHQLPPFQRALWRADGTLVWVRFLECGLFIAGGIQVLLLAVTDCWQRRDPPSFLLLCWTFGVFVFGSGVNWTINGRSFLPMVPAVGILLARRLEQRQASCSLALSLRALWPTLAAAPVVLLLVQADCDLANVDRTAARELCSKYQRPGHTLWFQGHWGFQYYMEHLGAVAMDLFNPQLAPGDVLVLPAGNSNVEHIPRDPARLLAFPQYPISAYATTIDIGLGAGFYASRWGPLPFVIEKVKSERFMVCEIVPAPGAGGQSDPSWETNRLQFEHALQVNPNDAETHLRLGLLLASQSRNEEAEKHFSEVVHLDPANGPAQLAWAESLLGRDKPAEAVPHYQAAVQAMPDLLQVLNEFAWLLATCPDPQERNGPGAVHLAERAVELTGQRAAVQMGTLAAAYAEAGRFSAAADAANKAISLAEAGSDEELAGKNRKLLEFYQSGRAYHSEPLELAR